MRPFGHRWLNGKNVFFMPVPIKLWALSVISTLSLLKSEPAGNYAKDLESFKTGKQHKHTKTRPKPKRKLPELLGVKKKGWNSTLYASQPSCVLLHDAVPSDAKSHVSPDGSPIGSSRTSERFFLNTPCFVCQVWPRAPSSFVNLQLYPYHSTSAQVKSGKGNCSNHSLVQFQSFSSC